jgi:adenylosuccinate lyase
MIERYARKEMADLWSLENKFRAWLEVELAICEAWHRLGKIPEQEMQTSASGRISISSASSRSRSGPSTT